jgi:hypothetical protein
MQNSVVRNLGLVWVILLMLMQTPINISAHSNAQMNLDDRNAIENNLNPGPFNQPGSSLRNCFPRMDWLFTYTVTRGDTLAKLARLTGTDIYTLSAGNCLVDANLLHVGQVLRIPVSLQPRVPGTKRITFQPGAVSATVQGQVAANSIDKWVLRAQAGQTLSAQLAFAAGQAILVVWGVDGTVLQSDHVEASIFNGMLPSTQDYFIDVKGTPNGLTSYSLTITIPPVSTPSPGTRRINFRPGSESDTVQGHLTRNGTDRWVLRAQAGQTMSAQIAFSFGRATLVVWGADGTVLQSDHVEASVFSGLLPATQDYFIDVKGNPDGPTDYSLIITIPPLR